MDCAIYTDIAIFFFYILSSSAGKWNVIVIPVFLSRLDHKPLFKDIQDLFLGED